MEAQLPKTLLEAVTYFSIAENASEFVRRIHWPDGNAKCAHCDSHNVTLMAKYQRFHCKDCRKQFSIKYGTIFEHSPLPLSKWLPVMWLMANAKNGISSHEIARAVGVTQKTAWFMSHRLREVMRTGTFKKLSGTVEADETFIGGSDKNRHAHKRRRMNPYMPEDKTVVMGMVERGGRVTAKVVDDTKARSLRPEIRKNIEAGSILYTDNHPSYDGLGGEYYRDTVNHADGQYKKGDTHTNNIENFWSLFKRCVKGTHIQLSPFHLDRYLDEECYRYNMRKSNDAVRFDVAMSRVLGRRLTYNVLTGKAL